MLVNLRRAVILSLVFLAFLGLAYPFAGTGVSMLFFKHQAEGSFVTDGSKVVGSTLIEQTWPGPRWFQGRPDGAVVTCNASPAPVLCSKDPRGVILSASVQLGPRSKALEQFVAQQAARLKQEGIVPTNDLVTNSGSLVDPDISRQDANVQVPAVAKANGLPQAELYKLVASHVTGRELGFLGAPYVNVLQLNLALAALEQK